LFSSFQLQRGSEIRLIDERPQRRHEIGRIVEWMIAVDFGIVVDPGLMATDEQFQGLAVASLRLSDQPPGLLFRLPADRRRDCACLILDLF
jgi:hypothetical protein